MRYILILGVLISLAACQENPNYERALIVEDIIENSANHLHERYWELAYMSKSLEYQNSDLKDFYSHSLSSIEQSDEQSSPKINAINEAFEKGGVVSTEDEKVLHQLLQNTYQLALDTIPQLMQTYESPLLTPELKQTLIDDYLTKMELRLPFNPQTLENTFDFSDLTNIEASALLHKAISHTITTRHLIYIYISVFGETIQRMRVGDYPVQQGSVFSAYVEKGAILEGQDSVNLFIYPYKNIRLVDSSEVRVVINGHRRFLTSPQTAFFYQFVPEKTGEDGLRIHMDMKHSMIKEYEWSDYYYFYKVIEEL